MKTWMKVLLAVALTAAMLFVTSKNSRGRPELVTHQENGYSFEMTTVPKILEHQHDQIKVTVTGPAQAVFNVYLRSIRKGYGGADIGEGETVRRMTPDPDQSNLFLINIRAYEKGGRLLYSIEARDPSGDVVAVLSPGEDETFVLKFIGEVPIYFLAPHILCIFVSFFFVAMATIQAISLIQEKTTEVRPMAIHMLWAVVFTFLGCYPFGIPMNWYAFGATWEGVPFGTDATDNKTQLLFVYLLFVLLSGLGSLTHGKFGRNIYPPKTLGWVGLSGFAFLMFIFLIPHSIQFSAALTYGFCYAVIGLIIAAYVVSYSRAGKRF